MTITLPSPVWTPEDEDDDDPEVIDPDPYPDPIPYDRSQQWLPQGTH